MKITKKEAVAFFTALDFSKAVGWSAAKLQEKLLMVADKVKEDQVPKGFEEFYASVCKAGKDIQVVAEEGEEKPEKPAAPAKGAKSKSKPVKGAKGKAKPAKSKAKPASKNGNRPLSDSKIGSAVTAEWKNVEDIAKEAGLTLKQTRSRLRHAVHRGLMASQRLSQYRLVGKAAAESKSE